MRKQESWPRSRRQSHRKCGAVCLASVPPCRNAALGQCSRAVAAQKDSTPKHQSGGAFSPSGFSSRHGMRPAFGTRRISPGAQPTPAGGLDRSFHLSGFRTIGRADCGAAGGGRLMGGPFLLGRSVPLWSDRAALANRPAAWRERDHRHGKSLRHGRSHLPCAA
jgi:hypothetical protein